MAIYLTQIDIDERLQQAYCCAGSLGFKISKEFRLGMKCAKSNLEKLFLLTVFIEILECYTPVNQVTPDETINCITEEKAQYLFEQISKTCKTCFGAINKTYE